MIFIFNFIANKKTRNCGSAKSRATRGQVVSAADPAGHLTHLRYDRLGRLTTLINPNRESWRFEYDATGRLTGQRDYAGRLTEYRHDALGQVTEVIRHSLPGSGEARWSPRLSMTCWGA